MIQSFLFRKRSWSVDQARSWLRSKGYTAKFLDDSAEKVHRFVQYHRPGLKRFRVKNIGKDIIVVFGFLK